MGIFYQCDVCGKKLYQASDITQNGIPAGCEKVENGIKCPECIVKNTDVPSKEKQLETAVEIIDCLINGKTDIQEVVELICQVCPHKPTDNKKTSILTAKCCQADNCKDGIKMLLRVDYNV